uniref:Putative endocytosis/signaling protein ehd1 n=1 Tax=Culex tarsalis TaxID=7177 RepID=A0A1Q3FPP2_CULTA
MARLSVWVLAGLALFALAGHELHVNADTPTEYECRPYIEKALQDLKTGPDATASQEEGDENLTTEEPSSTESPVDVTSQEEEDNTAAEETSIEEDVPEEAEPLTASEEVQEAIFDNAAEQDEVTASEEQEEQATEEAATEEETDDDGEDEDEQADAEQLTESEEAADEQDEDEEEQATESQEAEETASTEAADEAEDEETSQEAQPASEEEVTESDDDQDDDEDEETDDGDDQDDGNEEDNVSAEATEQDEDDEDDDDEDDEEQDDDDEEEQSAEQQEETDDTEASPEAVEASEASQEQEEADDDDDDDDDEEEDVVEEPSTEAVEEAEDEASAEQQQVSEEATSAEQQVSEEAVSAEAIEEDEAASAEQQQQVSEEATSAEQQVSEEADVEEATEDTASEEVVEPSAEETVESTEAAAETETASEEEQVALGEEASEEIVEKVEAASEEAAPASEEEPAEVTPEDSAEEAEPLPEEDLLLEYEIPTNRRDTSHIYELLHINDESAEKEAALHKVADVILRDLKKTYDTAIKPLETLYKYRDLSNRHFGDPEIFSKPLILFMGPWSGGKSTILNYLTQNEYTPNSVRTGAEPSPAYFNILMHGDEPEVLDGTQLAADWTFSGLQKFGQGLLDRLRGQKLPNKLLERVNIVEIPGILEVRKQVSQYFPFNDACQWFIDRADIIFLVYDPSKLDVGPETEAILDQLKGREYQTRILLNKADQVKPEELLRVQGALIWNISPLMSSAQPPVMYTVSLWSNPFETGAPVRLLQAQERSLLLDLGQAIEKRIENKIASARRFAVRVRNHAKMVDCYLTTYYNHKTLFANKKYVSDQIIGNPQQYHIYEGLSTLTNISRYDLPDPESYRDFFQLNPLYEFQKLSETCTYFRGCPINKLDIAIAYDLPELVGKYKKLAEAALEKLQLPSQTTDFGRLKASS